MAREHSDEKLISRAQRGDRSALTVLVRRHESRVLTLARGIVGNEHDAADVLQDTLIALVRHLDDFRGDAQLTTWLHRVAINKSYDLLRRRKRHADPTDVVEQQVVAGNPHEQQLAASAIIAAIGALDEGFREAVMLVDVLGASVDEAATVLRVAPGTVKSRVFRGRRDVARHLGTAGYEGTSDG